MEKRRNNINENLKIIRRKFNFTQEELANLISVTRQTISKWENGESVPSIDEVEKISDKLGIPMDVMVYGSKNEISNIINNKEQFIMKYNMLSNIKKGYYDITSTDIFEYEPNFPFDFSIIMGITKFLIELEFNIIDVYSNGFSIYLENDHEAQRFSKCIGDIIDKYFHCEESKAIIYADKYEEMLSSIKSTIMNGLKKEANKNKSKYKYFWVDENDNIRGYGETKKDCEIEAKIQQCKEYKILENKKDK